MSDRQKKLSSVLKNGQDSRFDRPPQLALSVGLSTGFTRVEFAFLTWSSAASRATNVEYLFERLFFAHLLRSHGGRMMPPMPRAQLVNFVQ